MGSRGNGLTMGGADEGQGDVEAPPVFTELLELTEYRDGVKEWKEVARWVKYQETVEEAGNRWSKPHVSTPGLAGLLQLRRLLKTGLNNLNLAAADYPAICRAVSETLMAEGVADEVTGTRVEELLQVKHRHQFEGIRQVSSGIYGAVRELLNKKIEKKGGRATVQDYNRQISEANVLEGKSSGSEDQKVNKGFLKKIPDSAEAALVLEGKLPGLLKPLSVFIRLEKAIVLPTLPEVDVPTRFLYILISPTDSQRAGGCSDTGRAMGTAFSDRNFIKEIYNADSKEELVESLDNYIDSIKTLPRDWNPKAYIEPPGGESEHEKGLQIPEEEVLDDDRRDREASGLVRTGRIFGGLIDDIKRKKKHYISDFKDGLHPQCISSFLYLYIANLAPIIAFGALLGKTTHKQIATIEGLVAGLLSGVLFSLFAGQPLNLLGSTGPVYVFEKILFELCETNEWNYLSLRLWIGIWVTIILLLLVAFDASALVCYITRFTEEMFASLVAFIFIQSAFKNVFKIKHQVEHNDYNKWPCDCTVNISAIMDPQHWNPTNASNATAPDLLKECIKAGGDMEGDGCGHGDDVFLMSIVLFFGVFIIANGLKQFKTTGFLSQGVRGFLADFAVIIGILVMTGVDFAFGLPTPKLAVPSEFQPTSDDRGWLVLDDKLFSNPMWVDGILAPLFALLASILLFMDQQITAVIVNNKDYKLKKGCGYHLDLLVLAVVVLISSFFGLPWFVANTIPSICHMQSLQKESTTSIPGEKPKSLGTREQRVTYLLISILTGLSVLMVPILSVLPMPVLYGVFLFMGISALRGLQFFDRILLLLMPTKYQPNYIYLKYVRLPRVHLFTFIQIVCLAVLYFIKSHPATGITFPLMLVAICVVRKCSEWIFTTSELRALDDLLPGKEKEKRKLGFKDDHSASTSLVDEEESVELSSELKRRKRGGVAYEDELEELMAREPKVQQNGQGKRNWSRAVSMISARSILSPPASEPPKTTLVFLRLDSAAVFLPVHLTPPTLSQLKTQLREKFSSLAEARIGSVMQKTTKGMTYVLDEEMVDYIQPRTVFVISSEENDDGLVDLTLAEQDI